MNKSIDYKQLVHSIALRSSCNIKVGCIIYDSHGVFAWGWNHPGRNGLGECAELHAIKRANRKRLTDSSIMVLAIRRGKFICSFPCPRCSSKLRTARIKYVTCHDNEKNWKRFRV